MSSNARQSTPSTFHPAYPMHKLVIRFPAAALLLALPFALGACKDSSQAEPETTLQQCGKDTDCKGERICQAGQCTAPSGTASKTAVGTDAAPIPDCRQGDGRTPIPTWRVSGDDDGNLSSAPPQQDGMIVRIELSATGPNAAEQCKSDDLISFSLPQNPADRMEGGLAVNFRGSAQYTNGSCLLQGYFMNEEVQGMHQGWAETYFGEVGMEKLVLSNRYCLAAAMR